jgi:redox-sensing transcriptional repressor
MRAPHKPRLRAADDAVSEFTTARLSLYLRCLEALDAAGIRTVSSTALAERLRLNAAQIRRDLAHFGELGVRGVGYDVKELRRHLRQVLGVDRDVHVAIVGAGNLGRALADYSGFRREGFDIVSLFDTAREKIGQSTRGGVLIRHLRELPVLAERERIDIAVVAVPAEAAQEVVDAVVAAGIRAILNFAPGTPRVPPHVKVRNMDLSLSLESLSFFLAQDNHGRPARS